MGYDAGVNGIAPMPAPLFPPYATHITVECWQCHHVTAGVAGGVNESKPPHCGTWAEVAAYSIILTCHHHDRAPALISGPLQPYRIATLHKARDLIKRTVRAC